MERDLATLRTEYRAAPLDESEADPDPLVQFLRWLDEALAAEVLEPDAMILATAPSGGRPAARTVSLRGLDDRGFVFYTSYESRKAQELAMAPRAALVFHWRELARQVHVEGRVARTTTAESAEYFAGRPRGSQVAAWASPQSAVVADRAALDARVVALETRFASGAVPLPPFWGGFRVDPDVLEYWQGRPNRLHDRLRYRRRGRGWLVERLGP